MTNHPSRAIDHLLRKMWQTKSARFNAHMRLQRRHWLSIAATSILSCYLVGISLFQLAFESSISPTERSLLSVTNIVVSVFLIVITLLENARNYGDEGERMRENAQAISKLYNKFQALTVTEADKQRDKFAQAYSDLLIDAKLNHKDIDRNLFRLPNATELKIDGTSYGTLLLQTVWLTIVEYWLYFSLVLVPPLLFGYFMQAF
jgi:SMODS and SLOG-associating 2TM effector domain family 5